MVSPLPTALFWCFAVAFAVCCLWAVTSWVLLLGSIRRSPWPSGQSVFSLSTAKKMSHPAYPFIRSFMLALGCGICTWLAGLGLGLAYGILH